MSKPPPPIPKKVGPAAPPAKATAPAKQFKVRSYSIENVGHKTLGYGPSGVGKTTLFSMMPDPVFFPMDDGGRLIRNPITGKPLDLVEGLKTFEDVRDALHQPRLFQEHKSIVIDTVTALEPWIEQQVLTTVKKDGASMVGKSIRDYGYNVGWTYVLERYRLLMSDLDALCQQGYHIGIIAQESAVSMPNTEGIDYLQAGPSLHHDKQISPRLYMGENVDHVLRIGFNDQVVVGQGVDAKVGKASSDTTRAIYTCGGRSFYAKSRTIKDPTVSFEEENDDSIWRIMFPSLYPDDE